LPVSAEAYPNLGLEHNYCRNDPSIASFGFESYPRRNFDPSTWHDLVTTPAYTQTRTAPWRGMSKSFPMWRITQPGHPNPTRPTSPTQPHTHTPSLMAYSWPRYMLGGLCSARHASDRAVSLKAQYCCGVYRYHKRQTTLPQNSNTARSSTRAQPTAPASVCGLRHSGGATSSPKARQRTRKWRGAKGRVVGTGTYCVQLMIICGTARAGSALRRAVGASAKTGRSVALPATDPPFDKLMLTAAAGRGVAARSRGTLGKPGCRVRRRCSRRRRTG